MMNRRKAIKNTGLTAAAFVLAPSLLTMFQSCKSEQRSTWKPLFLSDEEATCITALVDTILPRTKTPSGTDVKVDIFIDKVMAKTYDEAAQQNAKKEIAAFNQYCKDNHGGVFTSLNEQDKKSVLTHFEKTSPKFNGQVWGSPAGKQEPVGFYRSMKAMIIGAYFSSEEIGKKVLNYDPVPKVYKGCIPVSEVGNRWTF